MARKLFFCHFHDMHFHHFHDMHTWQEWWTGWIEWDVGQWFAVWNVSQKNWVSFRDYSFDGWYFYDWYSEAPISD